MHQIRIYKYQKILGSQHNNYVIYLSFKCNNGKLVLVSFWMFKLNADGNL